MNNLTERPKYLVTLVIRSAVTREAQFTRHAESPEHAIRKAKQDLGPEYEVLSATAEQIE